MKIVASLLAIVVILALPELAPKKPKWLSITIWLLGAWFACLIMRYGKFQIFQTAWIYIFLVGAFCALTWGGVQALPLLRKKKEDSQPYEKA